eukprot:CAMPEP_0206173078 /NCGR_PEP_ID=MMETSP1474-20131121/47701_1 /ASSEMBLY_ACC=CAM_ASM_001110 /TAXON_ID=97495 /ORGANISM="Imantonia sp., Strain RCC918" /LENGTH=262 /DNA_ID=CAMNT_0053581651 /DNA_START=223 /DNA_END=1011 /DNA_ORIENTATION=+
MATAPPIVLNAQLIAAALGGTFAGGLHAVTGPDHLAALLPLCIGRRWCAAMHTGAYWGLGHGIGAALVGALAYFVRGALNLDVLCTYMEAAVGLSIIIIGWNGVGEAREWRTEHEGPTQVAAQHNLEVALAQPAVETVGVGSTLLTGILHGCSGSGHLLGVLPALAMPSWSCASTYLVSFGLGTMLAMSLFTALVGEASVQMGERLNTPDVPAKMALASSIFAIVIGSLWSLRAAVTLGWAAPLRACAAVLVGQLGMRGAVA